MKTLMCLTVLLGTLWGTANPAPAQDADAELRRYDALVDNLSASMLEYDQALTEARRQMRAGNGELSNEQSAHVLHSREQLDLARSRLMALCAISGIPFPDVDFLTSKTSTDGNGQSTDSGHGFDQARRLVRRSFSEQAMHIAKTVQLPLLDIPGS